jgi:hypothetical protein
MAPAGGASRKGVYVKVVGMLTVILALVGCAGSGAEHRVASADDSDGHAAASDSAAPSAAAECQQPEMVGPVLVPESVYAARTGRDAVRFSQLSSTKERPLEECGLRTVLQRLATLTCDDGSNPFKGELQAAHQSRAGNVGPGGRCGSILDRYEVSCAEKTYSVFADMYLCTEQNAAQWLE